MIPGGVRIPVLVLSVVLSGAVTGTSGAAYLATVLLARADAPIVMPELPRPVTPATSGSPSPFEVGPVLHPVAQSFAHRLASRIRGTLLSLDERDGAIEAHWSSPTCDWTETEFLDLLEALHRDFSGDVGSVTGVRDCAGTTRHYHVSGRAFALYHAGRVSSPEVLRYLIEVRSAK